MDFLADPNVACDQGVSAAIGPSRAEEVKRAAERGKFLLPADRVIRSQTRDYRRFLVSGFRAVQPLFMDFLPKKRLMRKL